MDLSICKGSHQHGLTDWSKVSLKTFDDIENAIKAYNYAAFGELKDRYRKADNVINLSNVAIFDIDNDPGTEYLSIDEAKKLLHDKTFMLVTSRSHQKEKGGKPAVDRYRVIVPLSNGLTPIKENYRIEMTLIAEDLGLLEYTDHKALKDIARQYYRSPEDAMVVVNNTKEALQVQYFVNFAKEEIKVDKVKKQAIKDEIKNRILPSVLNDFNTIDYPKIINISAMNMLPLDEIYEFYTGYRLSNDGSYLMGKGVTGGTSQSGKTFTIFEDGNEWLWHDLKSQESGNVLTFMRALGMNAFEAAQELEKKFGVFLLIDNAAYYGNKINEALCNTYVFNDKTLKEELVLTVGAKFVKIDKDTIKFADKEFTYNELGISKGDIISRLKENRANDISMKL